jgi:hypothetical protein
MPCDVELIRPGHAAAPNGTINIPALALAPHRELSLGAGEVDQRREWLIGVLGSYRQHSQYPERRRTGGQSYERTESEAEYDPPDDDSPALKVMQARPQVAAQFSRSKREGKSKVGHLPAPPGMFVCWGHLLWG